MQAAILEAPGQLIIREVPIPEPGPGAVLIRVRAATTCGTDLKAYTRGHPKMPMPTRFGHEYAGEIVALGAGVSGWAVGDAVMGVQTGPCGTCYWCAREQEELCDQIMERVAWGAYAEYLELPDYIVRQNLYPKPPELPWAQAALLEPLASVVRGQRALTLRPDDTVLIVGAGPIALLHIIALRAAGVGAIHVSGRHTTRLATAAALGATVYDADMTDPGESVRAVTGGRGADVVIECTGHLTVWEQAVGWARRGGQVCLFGGCPAGTAVAWPTGRLHYDGVQVVSPFHFTPRDVRAARDLLLRESGPDSPFRHLLTGAAPLADLPAVFERLRAGEGVKYVIHP
jgi:L-iditol 2-dehydrogenase